MFGKLEEVEKRYEHVGQQLQEPGVAGDQKKFRSLMKELSDLEKVVSVYRLYKKTTREISDNKELLTAEKDQELKQMVREELISLEKTLHGTNEELKILLLPKDPNDDKNVIIEIRAGAGGDEACLFAEQLFRSYALYAAKKIGRLNWCLLLRVMLEE